MMITINRIREFEFRNRIIIPFRLLDSWIRMICFILLDFVHLFFFSFFFFRFEHCRVNCFIASSIVLRNNRPKGVWKFYLCLPSFIMRNAVSSYFSSAQNELHPFFHGTSRWMEIFFFFFFLFWTRARCKNTEFR